MLSRNRRSHKLQSKALRLGSPLLCQSLQLHLQKRRFCRRSLVGLRANQRSNRLRLRPNRAICVVLPATVTAVDAAAGATKRKDKIDAPGRAIRAGPVNSSRAEETGPKEASAGVSVLKGSETKRRRKRRAVLRMANALRGRNGPNVENVPREVLAQIGGTESSVATGLSAMNVRSEASARNAPAVSVRSDPA